MAKPFDRHIASIQRGDRYELRIRIEGDDATASRVALDERFRGPDGVWRPTACGSTRLAPDEALSLAAFLQTAVAAIKQERGR